MANIVFIVGMPASGKTHLAREIGKALGYPVLEKDELKEEMFDILGFKNYSEKTGLDLAATHVVMRAADCILSAGQSLILVNNFRDTTKHLATELLEKHDCKCVTVFLGGDGDVFYNRYVARDRAHSRHLGHVLQDHYPPFPGECLDHDMTRDEFATKFEKQGMDKFTLPGGRINVDATWPEKIDTGAVIEQIKSLLK